MANNVLLASDSFASGSLAVSWSALASFLKCKVVGSGASAVTEPNIAGTAAGQIWTAVSWPNDQISEITLGAGFQNTISTYCIPAVRMQAGASESGYVANITDGAIGTVSIYRKDSGAATRLGSQVTGLTIAAGDVWSLSAVGACISLYQNYKRIAFYFDTTYTSGDPGYEQFDSTTITRSQVSSWRGYSAIQQDGVWQKRGVVIPAIAGDLASSGYGAYQSSIIQDANAQILSGIVNKMWFSGGGTTANIYYAESPLADGQVWTRGASAVLNSYSNGQVVKVGATYHMFAQASNAQGSGSIDHLTSSDYGQTWSVADSAILSAGGAGAWDHLGFYVLASPVLIGSTWYMLYCGTATGGNLLFKTGVATSPALGGPWTKYASNPVMPNAVASTPVKVGNTWYTWAGSGPSSPVIASNNYNPTEATRWKSSDLLAWTLDVHSVHHSQLNEAVNAITAPVGGLIPTSVLDIGGKAHLYSISCPADGGAPQIYQVGLAVAPVPIASLVAQPEDGLQQIGVDAFTSGAGDLSADWTLPTGGTKLQIIAGPYVEPTATSTVCQAVRTRETYAANQYSKIVLQALTGTLAQSLVWPTVRNSLVALTNYEGRIASPTGTTDAAAGIYKRVAGTPTQIGPTSTCDPVVGDAWSLSVVDGSDGFPVLSLFQNDVLILQVQDQSATPLTTGNPGIQASSVLAIADAQIASWAGGNANVIPNYPPNNPTRGARSK